MIINETKLISYGIQHEKGIRAHVGVSAGNVYVFSANNAQKLIKTKRYRVASAYTEINGVKHKSAEGVLLPIDDVKPFVVNATKLIKNANFDLSDSTSQKGQKAQWVVERLLNLGRFPLPVHPTIVKDRELQRQGQDLIVKGVWHIEVKCDWEAGAKYKNLYCQIAERNFLKSY